MTYQFDHEPINDCHNFKTRAECPMFEFVCDGGFCNLSRKWVYDEYDELPNGKPDWCELVRVK